VHQCVRGRHGGGCHRRGHARNLRPGTLLVSRLTEAGEEVSIVPARPRSCGTGDQRPAHGSLLRGGFLPRKGGERRDRVAALMADGRTTVLLEAPGRVAATLAELAGVDATRRVAVVRELTKVHEEVWRGTLADAAESYGARQVRGEVVVVSAGRARPGRRATRPSMTRSGSVCASAGGGPTPDRPRGAEELGVPRRKAYEAVLRLRGAEEPRPEQ